ncbi:uncharacterized protein K460DRAFT_381892 [Cucurbitaria berberidis CBS 394.84]|uniref:DUF7918 domain-containing protein n=1 Tax=Cucurbitaria berberidis CBS 394.84 TaxID=1168544 RepID=A0A9P4LCI6_9PLEO|nr:uncharacterized protein K460DRAFT_381892 [Cucurbitaria berberidis CBS 394.84]KAF1850025.1 hypothetical protein K460DRAFT_381892 [Cucurbitaria berberidis CBS 394.84]
MAIINDCPGLRVEVVANGNALREYNDDQAGDAPNVVTRYLEVNGEGTFEILTKFLENYAGRHGVRVEVRLDGHKVDSYLLRLNQLKKEDGHRSSGAPSKIGGRWHTSNFLFSSFVFEQDSTRRLDKATEEKLKQTGTITVLFHEIKNIRWPRSSGQTPQAMNGVSKFGKYMIRLLKYYSVDEPVKQRRGKTLSYDNVNGKGDERAFATFRFKYRSLEIVAIIGMYRGHVNGLGDLNKKELLALLDHHRNANTPLKSIKRERDEAGSILENEKRQK